VGGDGVAERSWSISSVVVGERAQVAVAGELDATTAPVLEDELAGLAAEGVVSVVVDLAALQFIDSSGLRAILKGRELLEGRGGGIAISGASGIVERVIDMTGLNGLLSREGA
jgi:anti-sigma B factor antagonist